MLMEELASLKGPRLAFCIFNISHKKLYSKHHESSFP